MYHLKCASYMDVKNRMCWECGKVLRGRTDQKFCNGTCRNSYHNRKNSYNNNLIRHINYTLRHNRKVLDELVPADKNTVIVSRDELIARGFNFKYHTHTQKDANNKMYLFCYEIGILTTASGKVRIVRTADIRQTIPIPLVSRKKRKDKPSD